MALRVLLADESSTIKKVMHLSLQDYNVEVKAVPNGLDVLEVARSFQPEIIFADILLGKKNGYEVCAELKSDAQLHQVPVILMWSGFMEVDENKAKLAKPDDRLEKPFDAEILRTLVKKWIPRLASNQISDFLTFPKLPDFQESAPMPPANLAPAVSNPVFEEVDEPEDFQSIPLPQTHATAKPAFNAVQPTLSAPKESWSHQDLSQFKINIEEEDLTNDYQMAAQDLSGSSVATTFGKNGALEEISLEEMDLGAPVKIKPRTTAAPTELASMTQLSHERLESLVREQVRTVLENIAWKIIPDVTERIVREEIQKLLKDADKL